MSAASKILKLPRSLELLKALTSTATGPSAASSALLWKYFLVCTETPRVPGNLGQFTDKIRAIAADLRCDFQQDAVSGPSLQSDKMTF